LNVHEEKGKGLELGDARGQLLRFEFVPLGEGATAFDGPIFITDTQDDPATGQISGNVDFANNSEVDHAVSIAKTAFAEWSTTSITKRSQIMFAFRHWFHRHGQRWVRNRRQIFYLARAAMMASDTLRGASE
jgi:hypothetical protein